MTKKISLFSCLLLLCIIFPVWGLEDEVPKASGNFYFEYYLKGVPVVSGNKVDVFKIPTGLSAFRNNAYFLKDFKPSYVKTFDFEKDRVVLRTRIGTKINLHHPIELSYHKFLDNNLKLQFRKLFTDTLQKKLLDPDAAQQTGLIPDLVIDIPGLPKSVRRFIGDRPSRLSLSGNQKLTISGSSTKRYDRRLTEQGDGSSFSLDMKQDLNLLLRGTIGEKIHVNVRHTSDTNVGFGDPSNIEIEYKGDEDEIVQSIKGGNISLALSGSEFIRYSASSTGLFGIRSDFKIGDLEITAVASKEEAQKNVMKFTGTDVADSLQYRSRDFVNRTHYYTANPYDIFDTYEEGEAGAINGYVNNAIKTAPDGSWIVKNANLLPDRNQPFHVYLDRGEIDYAGNTIPGWEIGEDPEEFLPYSFEFLEVNTDYFIDYDTGIITMNMQVDRRFSIGVVYTQRDGIQIGNSDETNLRVKAIRRANQSINDTDTWKLQVRNIYNLNKKNIQNEGFRMNFFTRNPDGSLNYYVEENVVAGGVEINDYLRLDTNGDGVINGFDSTVDLTMGYILLPFIEPFKAFNDSIIYEQETFNSSDLENVTIYIAVIGKVGRDKIELGQMSLLPGSVRVIVDGETLQENVHYLVDYDFGNISFLTEKGRNPDSNIEINYEYRPLFAVESKTLMGVRADWNFGENTKLGGTFIYHSEKVNDRKPRIGNENKTLMMADIDGKVEVKPPFMTKMVDLIPLISTDTESKFSLSGEVAMTMPNVYGHKDQPNRKEAYIDDMETIIDSYPLGLTRLGWSPASKPSLTGLTKARPNWFNPDNILAEQVYSPEFLTLKERKEKVQVLTLRAIPPSISNPHINNQYWGGIMRYLGNEIDFSEKKYIELLVKVDQYPFQTIEPQVTLHIDLGDISEDFYIHNNGKGILNTEDGANGGIRDGILEPREDVGLDGITEGAPGDDPHDRFSIEKNEFGDFPYINGSSGNGVLDTEDLNKNGVLDVLNRYFQYSVNLNNTPYESEHNGWRLYRIPIDNYVIKSEVSTQPDMQRINFARVWLEVEELTRVNIAKMHLIGNKWQEGVVKDTNDRVIPVGELNALNISMTVGTVDNQNNREHYVSPPKVTTFSDGIPNLEQSLYVEYQNLQHDQYGLVLQRFRETQNLLSYGRFRYWAYLEQGRDNLLPSDKGDHDIVFRVGADSLNYYEIHYPAEAFSYNADGNKMKEDNWTEIDIPFNVLTSLKQSVESYLDMVEEIVELPINGRIEEVKIRVKGNRVTLTNVREISVGIVNNSNRSFSGRLYVNEIRAAEPYEDIGFASRATLNTTFADFSTLNIGLVWRTENFNTTTTRSSSPQIGGEESISLDINNRYNLHKFFPTGWGFNIPLTFIVNQTRGKPRYKANSDILRVDIVDDFEREREKRESNSKSAEVSFNQTASPRSKLLQYTIKNTTLRANIRQAENNTSTNADTTLVYGGTMTYNLNIPKESVGLKLGKNYSLYFLPQTFNNNVNYRAEFPRRWRWDTNLPDSVAVKWIKDRYSQDKEDLSVSSTVNFDLTSDFRSVLGFSQKRDLTKNELLWDKLPLGKELERDQNITLNYNPTFFSRIYTFSASGGVRYREMQRPLQQNLQNPLEEEYVYEFEGNVARTAKFNFVFKNKDLLSGLIDKYGSRTKTVTTPSKGDNSKEYLDEDVKSFDADKSFDSDRTTGIDGTNDKDFVADSQLSPHTDKVSPPVKEKLSDDAKNNDRNKAANETKESKALWARFLGIIARLDNLNAGYENSYGSRYSKKENRANFLYQLGVPGQFENESEDLDMMNNTDTFTLTTGYPIFTTLITNWSFSRSIDRRYSTASQKEITTVFPNLRITLTGFEKLIRAEKFMTSSRLNSSLVYTERIRGAIDWDKAHWDKPLSKQQSINLSPLLAWSANWNWNISTSVNYNYSMSQTVTYRETFESIQESNTGNLSGNISYSYRNPQGIKLPLFGTRMPVTNELTTELSGNWETSKSTNQGAQEKIVERDSQKYSFTPRLTYNFSKNIKGGLQSSYEMSQDKQRDEHIRTFSLSIWAEIIF